MEQLRAVVRFLCIATIFPIFFLIGIFLNTLFFASERRRYHWLSLATTYLGRCFCLILNIQIKIVGERQTEPGTLIVANHVGSPDIFVLAACFQACFVSKLELRNWPLLGLLTRLGATLFVDRSRKHEVKFTIEEIRNRLESGISVVLFPEAGVTNGVGINPFKTSHFESAILAHRPVLPVLIQYHDGHTPSIACWWDTSFFRHFHMLLKNPRLDVTVTIFPPLIGQDRRYLAEESFRLLKEKHEGE
jgi:1-acyl-sn-glycerol-3-phosphate acyltransferase